MSTIVMSTMVKSMLKGKCMESAICSSKMGSATKACLKKAVGKGWDLPLTWLGISIKGNIEKVLERDKEYSRPLMERSMKVVGVITRCMEGVERHFRMESALLFTTRMVRNWRLWLVNLKTRC